MSNHNYSQYSNKKNNTSKNYNRPEQEATIVENVMVPEAESMTVKPTVPEVKMVVEWNETAPKANVEPSETAPKANVESVKPVVVNETVETVTLPSTVTGTVSNCSKLNVRVKPAIDAEVVTILNNDSKVKIDPSRSTNEWLKIVTASGVEGYCMRKFVNAKL